MNFGFQIHNPTCINSYFFVFKHTSLCSCYGFDRKILDVLPNRGKEKIIADNDKLDEFPHNNCLTNSQHLIIKETRKKKESLIRTLHSTRFHPSPTLATFWGSMGNSYSFLPLLPLASRFDQISSDIGCTASQQKKKKRKICKKNQCLRQCTTT